jgi:hypothetical protein
MKDFFSEYLDYLCELHGEDFRAMRLTQVKAILPVHQWLILHDALKYNKKPKVLH